MKFIFQQNSNCLQISEQNSFRKMKTISMKHNKILSWIHHNKNELSQA